MRLLWCVVGAFVALYIVAFLAIAGAHLAYPYEVDNLEGGVWAMVARVASGHPLYSAPAVDYTPFCYGPLYFYASAGAFKLLGAGYTVLRAVSVIATLATATTIYVTLRCERVAPRFALIAVAIFLGAYGRTHEAGDVARVDAFALALALPAVALALTAAPRLRNACVAGMLGGLAVLAKQPMVVLVAAAALTHVIARRHAYACAFTAAAVATVISSIFIFDLDRWAYFYCITVPGSHHLRAWDLVVLAPVFLITTLPIALLVQRRDRWTLVTLAYIAMAILARAKEGGSANVFLPVVALAAIQLARSAERLHPALIAAQLALLVYSPIARWPTSGDVAAGDQLIARIAALPGDVYVPGFPAYGVLAGKPWHAHYVALCDVARLDPVRTALAARRFAAVLPVMDVAPIDLGRCDVPDLALVYRRTGSLAPLEPPPLFERVHRGKIGDVWR